MFAVAAAAYSTAINSRGVVRVTLSYVLATLILIFAIFTAVRYSQDTAFAHMEKERVKMEEQIRKAEEETRAEISKRITDSLTALNNAAATTEPVKEASAYAPLAQEGIALCNALLSVNVADESKDYDQLVAQAKALQNRAAALKRKIDSMEKDSEPARVQIEKGARFVTVSANTLSLYYRAENESEESERLNVYKQNANAAKAAFAAAQ
jgi:cell division protein FtsB